MTTNQTASLLISLFGMTGTVSAAIAALISSNVAKKSLIEQKENNDKAYKPFLVLEGEEYNFELKPGNPYDKLDWTTKQYDLKKNKTSYSFIKLLNINEGVARNIKVNLSIENVRPLLKKLMEKRDEDEIKELDFYIGKHNIFPDQTALYVNGIYKADTYETQANNIYQIDKLPGEKFVYLPNVNHGFERIKTPEGFIALLNLYFHSDVFESVDLLPRLNISISCEDISGKKINFNYLYRIKNYNHVSSIHHNDKVRILFECIEN